MNLLLTALFAISLSVKGVPFTPMECERLPKLNISRQAHSLTLANGEYTVFGGHTTGFIPTPTAEYYRRGKWHTVNMLYTHDGGFATVLRNGEVMLGGGFEKAFGVGQTWGVEVYNPVTHSFSYRPILDQKRALASALELEDGRILVTGNWYAPDDLEASENGQPFTKVKDVVVQRHMPYILQTSPDNVYILGYKDPYGKDVEPGWVDQLNGEPFRDALLEDWIPETAHGNQVQTGKYNYLLPARKAEKLAVIRVEDGRFSLLETACPIPLEGPWGAIDWQYGLQVEQESQTAWKHGKDADGRCYLLRIAYKENPAALEVFYSSPIGDLPYIVECLALPGGDYLMTGGIIADSYDTQASVLLFHTQPQPKKIPLWVWILLGAVLLGGLLLLLLRRRHAAVEESAPEKVLPDLQDEIIGLMENEQLFRKKDLRIADFATRLHTNTTYISAILNSQLGMSFPHFVTTYRIRYAQEQMRLYPEKKLSTIIEEAGFANENSFFRSFKAETGCTPAEWRERQG